MAIHRKVLAEYITQIREDMPGTCIHKRAEIITRGYDCKHFVVPKSEFKPIYCDLLLREVTSDCFCCWGEKRPYPKDFLRENQILEIER